ncbi:MAG: ATP-binding cassette domain-containing protein [Flavobacteriales bacterium]
MLRGFDLDVFTGENVMVLGKSGSGKSVLIECVVRLLMPDAGSIEVLGRDILALDEEELDKLRVKIGFLFQSSALYDSMTVQENLGSRSAAIEVATTRAERDASWRRCSAR